MNKIYLVAMRLPVLSTTTTTPDFSNFEPIVVLKTIAALVLAIVALIGYIQVGKNVMELGTAIQNQDSAGTSSALKGIAGAAIMAGLPTLMVLFGFVI